MHEQINQLFGYLHGLWRYRWSALLIAWVIAMMGWLAVYALPDVYESKAAIYLDTTSIMTPLLAGLAVETDPQEELNLMTRVLLSRDNLLSVMRETDMDLEANTPEEKERLVEDLRKSIDLKVPAESRGRQKITNIYEIKYQSPSAEHAYKVVSTLLNTLIENTLKSDRTDTVMAQNFLDEQIQEYERRLTAAEEQLVEFKKNNVGLMPDEQGGFYTRLQNAQSQIEKTKSDLRLAKERYTELRKQISGESPMLSSASYAGSSAARLREYREQLADLMTQFTDEHPDVQALRSKIENLQTSNTTDSYLNEPIGGGGTGEFNPVYQELKVQESQARIEVGRYQILLAEQQGNLNELQKSIDIMPQVEANLVKLNRDYEITKERYLSLVERRESARLARKVEQNSSDITFRVVDAPIVPHLASGPDRPLLLAGVLFVALGAGTAWSVLMFLLFPTFIDYKQLRSMIDLPVLGSISLYLGPEQKSHRRTQLMKFTLAILLLMGIFGSVLWFQEPGSALVRSFISGLGIYI